MSTKLVTLLISATLAACAGSGTYSGTYYASARVSTPDMAYVAPGVRVVADYEEPVFFSNGYYWYNYDGYWYRSNRWNGGWVYISTPPRAIARIDRPYAYRHYRPHNHVVRQRPVQRFERPVVRDHRDRAARRGGHYYRTR